MFAISWGELRGREDQIHGPHGGPFKCVLAAGGEGGEGGVGGVFLRTDFHSSLITPLLL